MLRGLAGMREEAEVGSANVLVLSSWEDAGAIIK